MDARDTTVAYTAALCNFSDFFKMTEYYSVTSPITNRDHTHFTILLSHVDLFRRPNITVYWVIVARATGKQHQLTTVTPPFKGNHVYNDKHLLKESIVYPVEPGHKDTSLNRTLPHFLLVFLVSRLEEFHCTHVYITWFSPHTLYFPQIGSPCLKFAHTHA